MWGLTRAELMMFIVVMIGVIAAILIFMGQTPRSVYTKDDADIDNTIIGDSADADDHNANPGPAYMGANWAFPMPLAIWNPVSSLRS